MKRGALERLGLSALPPAENSSQAQSQTEEAFGFKWARRESYESPAVQEAGRAWLFDRYCGGDARVLDKWLSGGRRVIVDAGCGSGYSALLFFAERLKDHDYLGVDISSAVDVAKQRFAERSFPGEFLRADLTTVPLPADSVDLIFSEGVLHHTDNTERAMKHLARALAPGGRFAFYVYAKKAVLREFSDDHIRAALRPMSDEEAWRALEPLTKLGVALGKLGVTIDVPEDIPFLGIKKGALDIQRFFYWNVMKLYYRQDWTMDEMNHVNFDWYRPLNCHRHTPDEVQRWCREAGLTIERFKVEEAGITVVARRPDSNGS
jgi:arsenite methyltransferase